METAARINQFDAHPDGIPRLVHRTGQQVRHLELLGNFQQRTCSIDLKGTVSRCDAEVGEPNQRVENFLGQAGAEVFIRFAGGGRGFKRQNCHGCDGRLFAATEPAKQQYENGKCCGRAQPCDHDASTPSLGLTHDRDEPIAGLWDRLDILGALCAVPEGGPQLGYAPGQRLVAHHSPSPDRVHQVVARDRLACMFDQLLQHGHDFRFEVNRTGRSHQSVLAGMNLKIA